MSDIFLERAQEWAKNSYFDDDSRSEVQNLIDQKNFKEIEERFYKGLEFGTGGMRAILGEGSNRLNKYNIRKATQAVAQTILETTEGKQKVAISYDSRRFSLEFAKEAARVFAANGIEALLYKQLNPVALCSFAIRHHQCAAGVMVTASHNPPEYNGLKVFWSDGAQVTPPHDKMIIDHFNSLKDYSLLKSMEFNEGINSKLIRWIGEETENEYYKRIKEQSILPELCKEEGDKLHIIYTAIHGTGSYPCTKALGDLGFTHVEEVEEQSKPNGDFPTVSSPNPENPEALKMAVDLLKEKSADIVLGTDPDTDRVGIALIHEEEVKYLNGNQIGILMLHYILDHLKEQGKMPSDPYFVKTIVTTPLQEVIAHHYGVLVENTLTGFKWICKRMGEIEKKAPHRSFLFATEESFGYLNHQDVRDKDGVSSITLISEIALFYKMKGMNLMQALDKIYNDFGFAHESLLCLNYYGKEGAEKIDRIMDHFRETKRKSFADMDILRREDYKSRESISFATNEKTSLDFPSSNVLGFHFVNGSRLYLRPSGTEPKIKFYVMVQKNTGTLDEKKSVAAALTDKMLDFINREVEPI